MLFRATCVVTVKFVVLWDVTSCNLVSSTLHHRQTYTSVNGVAAMETLNFCEFPVLVLQNASPFITTVLFSHLANNG